MGYLDPVTRRRIAAVLLVIGAIVAALAIANVGPFASPPTEADRARAALEDFFAAAERKDFGAVCATMTAGERSHVEIQATEVASSRISCAKVLNSPIGAALGRLRVTIEDVRVSGNLAAIDAKLRLPGAKSPEYRTYKLEELGGRWRISDISL